MLHFFNTKQGKQTVRRCNAIIYTSVASRKLPYTK